MSLLFGFACLDIVLFFLKAINGYTNVGEGTFMLIILLPTAIVSVLLHRLYDSHQYLGMISQLKKIHGISRFEYGAFGYVLLIGTGLLVAFL